MVQHSWLFVLATVALAASVASCSRYEKPERPAWRDQAEATCLAEHRAEPSAFLQPSRPIEGPGICGLNHPFWVYALADGTVKLKSASVLACSMIPMLDAWIKDVVQPDAIARFGEPVAQINTMGTYNCRGINNENGARLSEHAFGNAMDVGGFVLQSGREINVQHDWKSADIQDVGFLHDSHAGACNYFTTVLGPGANIFHYNHIHMDLAQHGNTSRGPRRYCKPVPDARQIPAPQIDNLPDPPPVEEEDDVASNPIPSPGYAGSNQMNLASAGPTSSCRPPSPATAHLFDNALPRPTPRSPAVSMDRAMALAPRSTLDLQQAGTEMPMRGSGLGLRPTGRVRASEPVSAYQDITSLLKSQAR